MKSTYNKDAYPIEKFKSVGDSRRPLALSRPFRHNQEVRLTGKQLWLVGLLAALAAGLWAWLGLTREAPEERLEAGFTALERGDVYAVERIAAQLEQEGQVHPARWLRGSAHVYEARRSLREAETLARRDLLVQGLQVALVRLDCVAGPLPLAPRNLLEAVRLQFRPELQAVLEAQRRGRASFARARTELSNIREHHALWVDAAALDGECLFRLGDLRGAAALLEEVTRRWPEHREAYRLLAALYYDLGAMKQAIAHSLSLAQLDPENGQPHRLIGMICRDYYRVADAIAAYREALKRRLPPADRAEVARQLAELLVDQLSKHEEALEALAQSPPGFDRQPPVLALKAECLWSLQRRDEARAAADAALAADADLAHALRIRGAMELDDERPASALPFLEKAVRLDPHEHKARDRLAAAFRRLGRVAQAEEQEQARDRLMQHKADLTELNLLALERPFDDQVRVKIARVWLEMGRPREAHGWLQAALACNPKNGDAQTLLEQIMGR